MTLTKTIQFDQLDIGAEFTIAERRYVKTSARKARLGPDEVLIASDDTWVTVIDADAMTRRDNKELAKPLFDGTAASCKMRRDFYILRSALNEVIRATAELDEMADYVTKKMADIKLKLRRACVETEQKPDRGMAKFMMTPAAAATDYIGLNTLGEIQGNGNVDMLVAALLGKRAAFRLLVEALGYRVTTLNADGTEVR
jgi:hypothetical protein